MFTGKTLVDGEWVFRRDCKSRSKTLGAVCQDSFSRKVTLVVHGELAGNVKDVDRGLSRKLLAVMQSRRAGRHIHVVDAAGYSDLLFGAPARCRDLKMQGDQVSVMPEVGDGFLGGPFDRLRLRSRGISRLEAHVLGRGTPRHEKLLSILIDQVAVRASLEVRAPARRGPQFDLGWIDGQIAYGTWVASPQPPGTGGLSRLEEAVLHVGRLVHGVSSQAQLQPVVVLEDSEDLASGLKETAKAVGVHVSKIAGFPGRK
ncbi:hypothetical protein [Streptomyces sp. NBC_00154]|uniref:hypothetical protein n=1 Tax=Streptomyces sp. NBC_00154 TaxID=2975670 RepID=UPI00225792E9|nr:hypothetical protein [Streptomyces sp. NBC_00154]MCX5317225.1 hypothetical protein [Streptomyces sp. NBC_00154]